MKSPKCSSCGGHAINQSEQWPTLWMCGGCKVTVLRALLHLGVNLHNNPFVYEICKGTHYFERESFRFYVDEQRGYYCIMHDRIEKIM